MSVYNKVEHDPVTNVKNEMKIEEDILSAVTMKTEIKKEDDVFSSKCFVCPACSIRYVNEDLFVGHIRQYHVSLCKQGDFQFRQHESKGEQELSSRILETNLKETNGLQVKQNPSIPANFDCSVEDKSEWGECSSSNRGNQSSNCKSDQLKTVKASYKCTERSYFTRRRSNLVRHETTHNGETEKHFKCSECS